MATFSLPRGSLAGRLLGGLLVLALAVTAWGWLTADLSAQNPKKEEEEEQAKPKKKAPAVEDDEPAKPRPRNGGRAKEEEEEPSVKPRKVIKVDDEDPSPAKPRPRLQPPPEPQAPSSLAEALRGTKNPELHELYSDLRVPHDAITVRSLGDQPRTFAVEPLTQYYPGEQPRFKNGYVQVWTYDAEWRRSSSMTKYTSALRVQPYEEIGLEAVEEFLKKEPAKLKLTRGEMLKAAETVLATADRFHASARETGARRGDDWRPVGQRLRQRLFELQRERLETFVTAGDWDGATAYARSLAEAYREPEERAPFAAPLVRLIQDSLKDQVGEPQLRQARDRFRQLEEIFGSSQAIQPIARGLLRHAKELLEEARRLEKAGKREEAGLRLRLAADLCPNLPELGDEMARMDQDYPVLRVGVRQLPSSMIPGHAATDADLRAIELIYEGLVKLRAEPGVGLRYVPALAAAAPALVPLGREFRIARHAGWSDGTPVTVGDVKETLRARKQESWPGHSPLWSKLVEDAESGGDSFRLSLRLSQGYIDPLSLMSFKVMPQSVLRQPPRSDALPLGSGPFKYKGPATVGNRKAAVFLANPVFSAREGKLGLPRIREIHFIQFAENEDPAAALRGGQIDVALDLSAKQASELRHGDTVTVRGPMTGRRVYFLALNHRRAPIRGNLFLRRALALAINRQGLLDTHFREAKGAKMHHSLNGPFPAGSWPCEPKQVPAELFDLDGAKGQARKAVETAGGPIRLTLKHAAADPATRAALNDLCESVTSALRIDDKTFIELKCAEVKPAELHEDVEITHQYEVAYYHYDHASEAYWMAPLFDVRAIEGSGSNYLGYADTALQTEFDRAKNRCNFHDVQTIMRTIHQTLDQNMPLIPLWQLDTFLAHRKGLNLDHVSVDPVLVFDDVESWPPPKK
jgi:ABC-type transport system substrate-binding protein